MTIEQLIEKKIAALNSYLKQSSDQLKDTRNLTINEEFQIVNKRYKALKSKQKLTQELDFIKEVK